MGFGARLVAPGDVGGRAGMNRERWQRVKSLLSQAIDLAPPERDPFLQRECQGDAELLHEVQSLLASHEQAESGFLNKPALELNRAPQVPTRVGRRIGAYNIIEQIGHGGMGEVYRADRADGQYQKEVAIKLVRGGYDSAAVLERFRQERQILASLDHTNIARLLDGGTTEDGLPYLVMELIDGKPILDYCVDRELSVNDRLQLFRQVCAAVQYAHQRLVIHRDLKPGNILVTTGGIPKLLDFGIAKLLDPTQGAEATLLGAMTPEYASPEQVRGDPITTASDVYSLGVVLYQLLTGKSPYGTSTRSPVDLNRAITDTDPERPSTAVLARRQDAAEASGGMDQSARLKLHRRLAGDMDNIILKALRKEPSRRYLSVEQFAEDIRRHLEGLPVLAVPDSLLYRTRKFVQRNKVGVIAAALVTAAVIGGVWMSLRQARIAEQQRIRAEKRFNDVRKLANSLIFEIHDSISSLPGATPSRKLLLNRAVEYLDNLAQDSGGDIDLQRDLAWGYERLATVQGDTTQSNLGQVSAAEESHRKALALFEAVAKANPHNVTDQLNLAMTYRMRAFFDVYVPPGMEEIKRALAVTDPLMITDGNNVEVKKERAQEYEILGSIQDAVGDRLKAVDTFRERLRLCEEILAAKPDDPNIQQRIAKAQVVLGEQLARFGSRKEGISLLDQAIKEYEVLVKETGNPGVTRDLASALSRRADTELMNGDFAAATADFRRPLELLARPAKLDPENKMLQSDVWVGEFEMGRALAVAGKYSEALPILVRSFDGYKSLQMEDDVGPGPGAMQAWIAEAEAGLHRFPEALNSYQQARTILKRDESSYDDARCDIAMIGTKIAGVLVKMGRLSDAKEEYSKALDEAKLPFSLEHMDIPSLIAGADAYAGLGDVALAMARIESNQQARARLFSEARDQYRKSLDLWKRVPTPSRYGPNDYLSRTPGDVAESLAQCERQSSLVLQPAK